MTLDAPIRRPSARVLVINADNKLLLFHATDSPTDVPDFWFTPGGALEQDETYEDAAYREMGEEIGAVNLELGPLVWTRTTTFGWDGHRYLAAEQYFVVRMDRLGRIAPEFDSDIEASAIALHRWWTATEILAATDQTFFPPGLGDLLAGLLVALPDPPINLDL